MQPNDKPPYPHGYTIGIYIPKEAPAGVADDLINRLTELVYGELLEDRENWDPFVFGYGADVFQVDTEGHDCCPQHVYLSTSCFHGNHDYCQRERGLIGLKTPGVCKFCTAPCVCKCHAEKREPVDG